MYRFLIVEDEPHTLEQVMKYLQEAFPGAAVIAGETVPEGKHLVVNAESPFDCVILDFRLPEKKNCESKSDTSLCQLVREKMPRAVVAHVSAFLEADDVIKQHIKKCHTEQLDSNSFALAKDERWVSSLGAKLKSHFYGERIGNQLDDLFGREDEEMRERSDHGERRNGARPVHDTTYLLARVCHDIVAYWQDLDEGLKQRIRRFFKVVEESGKPVRVGLL